MNTVWGHPVEKNRWARCPATDYFCSECDATLVFLQEKCTECGCCIDWINREENLDKTDEVTTMEDDELFELVRRNYAEANKEYIQDQIRIASEYLTEEQNLDLT